jgi:probable rRNA maturation factor
MLDFDVLTHGKAAFLLRPAHIKKIAKKLGNLQPLKRLRARAGLALISEKDMKELNRTFRGKNKPTDILSFPQFSPKELGRIAGAKKTARQIVYLGDILLCKNPVIKMARARKKPLEHHVTHLVVHGLLHLLGYDHMQKKEARRMERTEKELLRRLRIPDPYVTDAAAKTRQRRKTR